MDWDPTMQVIPWVGCQSKMKSTNFEVTEIGRRKGRNKNNEGFRVKMDFFFFLFCFVSENGKQIEFFFLLRKKTTGKKSKRKKNQI